MYITSPKTIMFTLKKWYPVVMEINKTIGMTECGICRSLLENPCLKCSNEVPFVPNKCPLSYNKNCNHIFHTHCKLEWKNNTCPYDMLNWIDKT